MLTNVEENQTGFDFDFDAAYFYGYDKAWLLNEVFVFLRDNPDIRGVEFEDFNAELEKNTGLEVSVQELATLLRRVGSL
jgi:hypothetical protein